MGWKYFWMSKHIWQNSNDFTSYDFDFLAIAQSTNQSATIRSTWNFFRVWNFKKIGSKYGVQKVGSLLLKKRRGSHAEVLYFWFVLISPILKTQKFHCELWWWFWTSESNPGFTNLKCQTLVPWRCCQNINAPSYIILTHCGMYNLILMSLYGFCFECTAQYLCIIRRVDNSLISTQSSLVLG